MELTIKQVFSLFLWILWCTLHSTLIATPVTNYLKKKLGDLFRFYRLFFNAVSFATLLPVVYFSTSTGQASVFRWEGPLMIVKYLLLAASIILFIVGGRHYSMAQFLGIRQIKTGQANLALSEHNTFDASGILSAIRHPWYTASVLFIWARDLSISILLINIVLTAYFVVGTILEERKLILEFGERYQEYQKNVSMFFPYKWLKAKIAGRP